MQVAKNYLYNAAYQLLNIIVPIITLPYLARVLGKDGVGIASWTNSLVTYFLLIASLGIVTYGSREIAYVHEDEALRQKKFWEIQTIHFLAGGLAIILYIAFIYAGGAMNSRIEHYQLFLWYQIWVIFSGIFDISWYFMGLEDFKKTVLRNMLIKLLMTALIFIMVKTPNDVGAYILLLAISQVVGNLSMWFYLIGKFKLPKLSSLDLNIHWKPVFLMFLPTIATQIYLQLNKTMLPFITGSTASSGIYDNADKIIKVCLALVTSVGMVMLPRMSAHFAAGEHDQMKKAIHSSMDFVSAIAIPLAAGIAAVGPTAMLWFLGKSWGEVGTALVLLTPIIVFIGWSNVIGNQFLIPTKRLNDYTWSVTFGALLNILLNFFFIYLWGVAGAAIATALSELAVIGYQLVVTRHDMTVWAHFTGIWRYLLASAIMYGVVTAFVSTHGIGIVSTAVESLIGISVYLLVLLLLRAPILNQLLKRTIFR
ncbi:PST family polysaccharide transporter [Fructobacillus fructosus]|uniref:Membrane protein involved in the export of O-antigen and teichoic acid (RfbX) n=1 Tax=Fructobacillus fructosus TaxID=1631 RepID=A0ABN9YSH4_9LACO|nr:flippase [Fructobacillus fructosus]KRN52530.1 PST family polysaccharide transporter [Fructobacillus fructosus KCTC 3544]GAP01263.1 PST family polysaccharide transporter [Fructobacillus fructosus]CAK1242423.1 Membrane protein involved in the export of O-antigen and teichoic acid (RfbX) [Fructobacillus fructosus]